MDITNIIFICALIGGLAFFIKTIIEFLLNIPTLIEIIWMRLPLVRKISTVFRYESGVSYDDIYARPIHIIKYFQYRIKYYYWRKFKETKFYKLIKKWIIRLKSLNQKKI